MQFMHAICQVVAKGLMTFMAQGRSCSWAIWAVLASFAWTVATAFRAVWAHDLCRIKETFIRRLNAQTDLIEAEARIKEAEAHRKTAEAITVAGRINTKALRRAKRVFK